MRRLFAICVFMFAPAAAWAADSADQQARALFSADWQWRLQTQPELATALGDSRYNTALSDTSLAASLAATEHEQDAGAGPPDRAARLTGQNQLSYDMFIEQKERKLKAASFYPYNAQPLTAQDGIHLSFPQAGGRRCRSHRSRLPQLPGAHRRPAGPHRRRDRADARSDAQRLGRAQGHRARGARPCCKQLRESLPGGALGMPFREIPATIPKPVRDELASPARPRCAAKAAPALQKLEDFVRMEYLPAARDTIAASSLPGGAEYYQFALSENTGAGMTPAGVHALGLKEVARIRGEMRAAIARTGFRGSFRSSPPSPTATRACSPPAPSSCWRATASCRARQRRLAAPVRQRAVRAAGGQAGAGNGAENQGAAYYEAAADGRPAALVVNTARLDTRPLWETETLALHEGVPGHHLQVARAHELADLPAFRRYGWYVAFGEGWALYAESLGPELGFFADPFSAFGHLNSELLRAARLVADTGIHALGWSRQQALDYLAANTANPPADNEIEVDRYIAAPGQALGYKSRPAADQRAARKGPSGAGRAGSTCAVFTARCSTTGRCRWRCSSSRWSAGSSLRRATVPLR